MRSASPRSSSLRRRIAPSHSAIRCPSTSALTSSGAPSAAVCSAKRSVGVLFEVKRIPRLFAHPVRKLVDLLLELDHPGLAADRRLVEARELVHLPPRRFGGELPVDSV